MKKSISVVIPNYNGRNLLEKNLPLLFMALKATNAPYEVIISDDCSRDDSLIFLKAEYPNIVLLESKINRGFSGNMNAGIKKAKNDLVFILNSDIELTEDYFNPLFAYFDDEKTFGVMGRIIALDSDKIQDTAKYPLFENNSLTATRNYLPKTFSSEKPLPSLFLSGANALVDRKKLLEMGSFQELFNPFYWEDVELGVKAWRLGYSCYYEHSAICRHPISATIGKYHRKKSVDIIARKNKILFHYLHLEGSSLSRWMVLYAFKALFRSLSFNNRYLKAFKLFLSQFLAAREAKKTFEKLQKTKGTRALTLQKITQSIKEEIGNIPLETF